MKRKFAVLLAAVVLVLSFTACTDPMKNKDPVEPEVPPVTTPEVDTDLGDDMTPGDDAGEPDDMLPDEDMSDDDDVLPDNVLPEDDVLDDGTTNDDVTDND